MRWIKGLFLCVLCLAVTAVVTAQETPVPKDEAKPETAQEVTVALTLAKPDADVQVPYGESRALPMESTAPRFLFEIPKFETDTPLYFRVDLGETGGVPFFGALDRSKGGEHYDRLYLDRNRDQDLTNDGEPLQARLREMRETGRTLVEFLNVELELPYRNEKKNFVESYRCVFFYYVGKNKAPVIVQVERDGWREGRVDIGGKPHLVAVLDDDNNGIFTESDSWELRPLDQGRKGLLSRARTRHLLYPSWSHEQTWMVEAGSIDPAGRELKLKIYKAKETEREYFVRIARRQQGAEEQQLDIDPLRPKIKRGQEIQWLRKETLARALEIGRTVKKRVLVDFWAKDCVWCKRMDRYTLTDLEVAQLGKRFVCIKLEHKDGAATSHKYGIKGTPTYVILENDGSELARHEGFLKPSSFAALLKRTLK